MSGVVMAYSTPREHADLSIDHKAHDKSTPCCPTVLAECRARSLAVRCMCSPFGTWTCVPSVPLAVDATLLHSVGSECGRKEKACASTKSVPLKSFKPGTYSRKVFIGGLPPDLDAGKLHMRLGVWGWGDGLCMYLCISYIQVYLVRAQYACHDCFNSADQCPVCSTCMHSCK